MAYHRAQRASQKLIRSEGENPDDWLRFFLTSLKKQKDVLLGKIEREQFRKRGLTDHNNALESLQMFGTIRARTSFSYIKEQP